jgi:ABC-type branched-subunit amino acid transport system ATPase component/branched-subunit amino acid ABC-type transport system permease component
MHQFLPFIVIGLATGAVYGLAGMGLVLTYKTSGIFNFGYGAVAALGAFLFYFLYSEYHVPWPWAAIISVFVFAPVVGLVLELLARSLDGASETIKVVATVGLILIVEALGLLWHPSNQPSFPHFLSQSTVRILSVNITYEQIILFVFSVVAAAVLYWFFQSVRMGIVMRGVVDNHELVSMSGDDPVRVRRWAWIIGTMFAMVAGLMVAPSQQLDGVTLTTLVFAAFGAAAIGYFTNLPLTFVGGLIIGVAGALMDKYSATISWIGGLPVSLPFLILFIVLVVTPRGRLMQRRLVAQTQVRRSYHAPIPVRLAAGAVAVFLLAMIPEWQASHLIVWSQALIDMILLLSLGLLVRRSGQISLCQLAFAAVGAAAFGHFAAHHNMPWLLALVLATLVAVPVGAIVAIPAVRVSGVFLALATLGLGILIEQVFYTRSYMFGNTTLGIEDPRPHVSIGGWHLYTDKGFYYLLLVMVVLAVITVTVISSGRLGRLLEAMADSPLALETQGATSSVLKVIVFCITAAMASTAGALTGMLDHYAVGINFPAFNSLTLVVLVVIITIGEPWYALIGAIGLDVIPAWIHGANTRNYLLLIFGVTAALAAYGTKGGTTPMALRRVLDRLGGRKPAPVLAPVAPAGMAPAGMAPAAGGSPAAVADRAEWVEEAVPAGAGAFSAGARVAGDGKAAKSGEVAERDGLLVRDLTVQFGGVRAVNKVTLKAPMGVITGLIGPNGAGKTTIFNACNGLNRPSSGEILMHGADLGHRGAAPRARRGLGRTFQRPELFNSLTVRQNVSMGREAAIAGANPVAQLFGSRQSSRLIDAEADEALALTGAARIADIQVGLLPIGQRRLVELARALAGPFDLLLLDEPSSGLDGRETEEFGRVLRTVVGERSCGILLVEHDMTLVRDVCDFVYVLDFGSLIFEGTPDEMQNSQDVRSAYLGDADAVTVGAQEDSPGDDGPGPFVSGD